MKNKEVAFISPLKIKIDSIVNLFYSEPENYNEIKESIMESGIKEPIVVDLNNVIISGKTRLKIAIEIGLETIPVIYDDQLRITEKVKRLNEEHKKYNKLISRFRIKRK